MIADLDRIAGVAHQPADHAEARAMAEAAGLTVIMNRCPKIEFGRLSGEIGWFGVNRRVIDNRKPLGFSQGGSLRRD